MNIIQFEIEKTLFQVSQESLLESQFVVKSVPKSYQVRFSSVSPVLEIQKLLDENLNNLLLIDKQVFELHFQSLNLHPDRLFLVPASEEFKSLKQGVLTTLDWISRSGLTKSDRLIVVGGGIVQDIGAFIACVFKRGIPWTFFPTTVLSMADSCIGGKTGINYEQFKNQVALFSAPQEVVIQLEFLTTLPIVEIKSGLGEVLKLHITGGSYFMQRYETMIHQESGLKELIWNALLIKKAVVEYDEFELNLRKSMNYGHTLGHAIENLSNFSISHGKAITIGMWIVNQMAVNRNLLNPETHKKLIQQMKTILDEETILALRKIDFDKITDALSRDKKNTGSVLNLVMLSELGKLFFMKINNDLLFKQELIQILSCIAI